MKIIAIPYAAGTAYAFQSIQSRLKPFVHFDVFEYPGHGQKMWMPLKESIPEMAQELLKEMFPIYEPYCLLGYSLGGHVLCELYRLITEKKYPLPVHVFLCAADIPNQQPEEIVDISDQALHDELADFGGTSTEILENKEFMEMLLPIYRADIIAEKNYVLPYEQLFRCEGTVIIGKEEIKEDSHFYEWQRYFVRPIRFFDINSGHFFIQEDPDAFSTVINETVAKMERE